MKKLIKIMLILFLCSPFYSYPIGKFFKKAVKKTRSFTKKAVRETRKGITTAVKETEKGIKKAVKEVEKAFTQTYASITVTNNYVPEQGNIQAAAFGDIPNLPKEFKKILDIEGITQKAACTVPGGKSLTCPTINVALGKSGTVEVKYPSPTGYELVVQAGNEIWKSKNSLKDKARLNFPQDFIFDRLLNADKKWSQNQTCNTGNCANGFPENWSKRWNEVVALRTHNAQSHEGKIISNQDEDIETQLQRGLRDFHIALHFDARVGGGQTILTCHGLYASDVVARLQPVADNPIAKTLGFQKIFEKAKAEITQPGKFIGCVFDPATRPLEDTLKIVKSFLDKNKNEIISISFGGTVRDWDKLASLITQIGLESYAHAQDLGKPWPTMGELITQNKRLIIFTRGVTGRDWLNNGGNFIYSTAYGHKTPEAIAKDDSTPGNLKTNRNFTQRLQGNKIFVVPHSTTPLVGGDKADAQKVNARPILLPRILNLSKETGVLPKFIDLDFYEYGNAWAVTRQLNGNGEFASTPIRFPISKPWWQYPVPRGFKL